LQASGQSLGKCATEQDEVLMAACLQADGFFVFGRDQVFTQIPGLSLRWGFINDAIGAHGSRTIMVSELRLLLAACPSTVTFDDYRLAILENNALLKKTDGTRNESLRRLRELYALDEDVLLFRALRDLWNDDADAQPMLAMLCAISRDPTLRGTADFILSLPAGAEVTPQMISAAADRSFPERFNATTLANIGRHAASSWQQSGHLQGRSKKMRTRAVSRPAPVAYALLLGYLCGIQGDALFQTFWCQLLDAPEHVVRSQVIAASQRGWLEYRRAGNVTEVTFRHLLRDVQLNTLI